VEALFEHGISDSNSFRIQLHGTFDTIAAMPVVDRP
jgi:hypothetical protein